jgi:hypothetical protein
MPHLYMRLVARLPKKPRTHRRPDNGLFFGRMPLLVAFESRRTEPLFSLLEGSAVRLWTQRLSVN